MSRTRSSTGSHQPLQNVMTSSSRRCLGYAPNYPFDPPTTQSWCTIPTRLDPDPLVRAASLLWNGRNFLRKFRRDGMMKTDSSCAVYTKTLLCYKFGSPHAFLFIVCGPYPRYIPPPYPLNVKLTPRSFVKCLRFIIFCTIKNKLV